MSSDRCIWAVQRLLNTQVGQRVLAENGSGVHVGGHEPTLSRQRLLRRQTFHVGALQQHTEIFVQVGDGCVDGDFIFPLELDPHGAKLGVGTRSRNDVVHDVDVDGVEDDHVGGGSGVVN